MRKEITAGLCAISMLLLDGCNEETQKAVAEATAKSVALGQESGTEVTDATKQTATKLAQETAQTATKAVETVKESATQAIDEAKEELSKVVVAQAPGDRGKVLFASCVQCHGEHGEKHALGRSALLAGQSASDIANKLKAYQEGKRNVAGGGALMQAQLSALSRADLLALAEYISTLKVTQ